jgi:hypothetical protein
MRNYSQSSAKNDIYQYQGVILGSRQAGLAGLSDSGLDFSEKSGYHIGVKVESSPLQPRPFARTSYETGTQTIAFPVRTARRANARRVFCCLLGRGPVTVESEKNTAREKNADSKPTSAKGPQRP